MQNPFSRALIALAFVTGCTRGTESGAHRSDFSMLTEEAKRMPENALMSMDVAEGLEVELFAAEPMVTNPTNISVDAWGRVWVCEAPNYDVSPQNADPQGDRIVVLEDTDHDGKADKRTVFYQGNDITTPLGVMALGNKVYITRSPNILVLTDEDGDLVADRKDTVFTNLGSKGDHSAHALFPGPDGNFYFSTGNHAGEIHTPRGSAIQDPSGAVINQKGNPFLGGMVLRFEEGQENVSVLGHNFRNNYEPCINSFGEIWQSDNDDDGNASVRINFVMPFGNYGFLDEVTRASWTTNRINMEKEIPRRHWHQNDPGVVPNVLITGAGSPAGMTSYEGEALPGFKGTILHAEPYYNLVRAYVPQRYGAGYSAAIRPILHSDDQWFRPVDVGVAPDGSIFIADWYDPILGGGAAGDANQGRIYRVAVNAKHYQVTPPQFSTAAGAVQALQNANGETRYMAFRALASLGEASRTALLQLWNDNGAVLRARALWLLSRLDPSGEFLRQALADSDPLIRAAAVRCALQTQEDVVPFISSLAEDPDVHVRREVATSLRFVNTTAGAALWSILANQHNGKDRWYLEALGIGADLHPDLYFDTWVRNTRPDLGNPAHRDIIWRMRSSRTLPWLVKIIRQAADTSTSLPYFRAFDFHQDPSKNEMLATLLDLPNTQGAEISVLALQQMDADHLSHTPRLETALANAMRQTEGTLTFVNLVRKFNRVEEVDALVALAVQEDGSEIGAAAADLLIKFESFSALSKILSGRDSGAIRLLHSLKGKSNASILELLHTVVSTPTRSLAVRQAAIRTLGSSWPGEERLLLLVQGKDFDPALKPVASSILFNVYRRMIQQEAGKFLDPPAALGATLPPIKTLLASTGNPERGKAVFSTYCTACHRVRGEGVKFGPELSQVGSKMSRDGLYRAILFPNEGISNGYESTLIRTQDGREVMGIVSSETKEEILLTTPGGTSTTVQKAQVQSLSVDSNSLMPALAGSMSQQQLIDLVTYLSDLKTK